MAARYAKVAKPLQTMLAASLVRLEGTNTGPGGTGNRVEVSGWEYWHMTDDGLVAESAGHFDAADYERQIEGR
jgi:hypothetical protein